MSKDESLFVTRFPPGHFYSPLPEMEEVVGRKDRLFGPPPAEIPGVDLRVENQIELFSKLTAEQLPQLPPYRMEAIKEYRFYHGNDFFSRKDAATLFCMLQHLRPARVIEVGSGHSSAVMLDTNEHFRDRSMQLTFIDPYPERLNKLLKREDTQSASIHPCQVQDIDQSLFQTLEAGDILFIDSSHISKVGSDLNTLLFEVVPALKSGVYVHFHDIFYPFEYPEHWVLQGRAWNENYLIRAFLQYNETFEIQIFLNYLLKMHSPLFEHNGWERIPEGGSCTGLWLRKK